MQDFIDDTTVIILVGGESRRFNHQIKALLPYKGVTLLENQISKLKSKFANIVLSVSTEEVAKKLGPYDFNIIIDSHETPLHSIIELLSNVDSKFVLVVPVDLPRISTNHCLTLIKALVDLKADLATNLIQDQWITSSYFAIQTKNWNMPQVKQTLKNRNRLTDLIRYPESLALIKYQEAESFLNVNTRKEYAMMDQNYKDSSFDTMYNLHPRSYLRSTKNIISEAILDEIKSWVPQVTHIKNHIFDDIQIELSGDEKTKTLELISKF